MSETASLALPLLQPSQAQKHVTVNEALLRLDGMVQIKVISRALNDPPETVSDGDCFIVALGGLNAWAGQDQRLAVYSNGGWIFLEPQDGWQGWLIEEHCTVRFTRGGWHSAVLAEARNGAASRLLVAETEFSLQPGAAQFVPVTIPKESMVFACSARISEEITGSLSSWSLGFESEPQKFGQGMGLSAGSYCTGLLSQPTTYYESLQPWVSPIGGVFSGGVLKVAVHYLVLDLPT